ncbi:MAG: hypothetical protein ACM3SR_09260 [Ignavibacteriales bacterium]
MATQKFSMGEAIEFGWNITKNNLGFFIVLLIIAGLILIIPGTFSQLTRHNAPGLSIILSIGSFVLQLIIGMGLIRIALRFYDNEKAEFSDLFCCLHLFFKYLLGSILYGLIVSAGMILLIIPGIIWAIKFYFFGYLIVDKGLGPIEALKRSSAITDGVKWDLLLFGLLIFGINLIGAIPFFLGWFVTIPIAMVATAFVYRKLLSEMGVPKTDITQISGAPINP